MNKATICTIVANNYLAHARTLAQTFLDHHPDGKVFVLLVGEPEGCYDPDKEIFETVLVEQLPIPNFAQMAFRYTALELCTAVKPFFLAHLFNRYRLEKLCYLDPDITIHHPLDEIFTLLDDHLMVLVPHITDFIEPDGQAPDEQNILISGVYNLGFIGLSKHPELDRFLGWWQRRLEKQCIVDVERGLFVDQRWMDLAPALFEDVYIHRDPGCDVAFWNLNHRDIEKDASGYSVNGSPLKFFHFSGFKIEDIESISIHQNRYKLDELPNLRSLYEWYRRLLYNNGYPEVKDWLYKYDYFDNGVKINRFMRYLWRNTDGYEARWPDPGNTRVENPFIEWLNKPIESERNKLLVTNFSMEVYRQRRDSHKVFPDPLRQNRVAFARWIVLYASKEEKIDDYFIKPMYDSLVRSANGDLRKVVKGRENRIKSWAYQIYLKNDSLRRIYQRMKSIVRG